MAAMGRRWQTARGVMTRERILEVGVELIGREGLRGLSMRAIARACAIGVSTVQFHYLDFDELAREVIRVWGQGITEDLRTEAGRARGLERAACLAKAWVCLTPSPLIDVHALRAAGATEVETAGRMYLKVVDGWVGLTRQALAQARATGELVSGVDVERAALELHALLWSCAWMGALRGRDDARHLVFDLAMQRLAAIAAPGVELRRPKLPESRPDRDRPRRHPIAQAPTGLLPTWRVVLTPDDPVFQAFLRHEQEGDPRSFFNTPEVLAEDIAAAKEAAQNDQLDAEP